MKARDYLSRIAAAAPNGVTAEALRELHAAHLRAVPFENLDIHRGVPIVLEEARILRKVVADRRGGFCYELNGAFYWLLTELGFDVALLSAEVARPGGGFGIPFDHMALRVDIEGEPWLADVGFGDSFVHPLRLVEGQTQEEAEYRYRLTRQGPYWHVERAPLDAEGYKTQYRFTTAPRTLAEFRSGCEYHQTSPQSTFTQKVLATRALEDGRITVTPERVIVRQGKTRSETALGDENEFRDVLARHLGILLEGP